MAARLLAGAALALAAASAFAQDLPAPTQLAAGYPSQPVVAAEGARVAVIWQDSPVGPWTWQMRRSGDGGRSFDPAAPLAFLPGLAYPRVVFAGGRLHFCWDASSGGGLDDVYYASLDWASGAASPPKRLSGGTSSARYCHVHAAGAHVVVGWSDVSASLLLSAMLMRRSSDGGSSFGPEVELGWTAGGFPKGALSGDGTFHAAWTTEDAQDKGLWHARVGAGAGGPRKQRVLTDLGVFALDARGPTVVLAAWRTALVSGNGGAAFGKRADLDPPSRPGDLPDGRIGLYAVAAHAGDGVIGVVSTREFGGEVYFSGSYDGGATFSRPENLSLQQFPWGGRSSIDPRILAAGKALVVAWSEMDGQKRETQLAFRSSLDRGRTFGPARRMRIETRRYNSYSAAAVQAAGDALVFAWAEPGEAREKREGKVWVLRVQP